MSECSDTTRAWFDPIVPAPKTPTPVDTTRVTLPVRRAVYREPARRGNAWHTGRATRVMSAFVHPTAIVEEGASLGDGTSVWHHVHVRAGARVGRNCTLGKNVFVDRDVSIGDRVKVQNNVSVYAGVTLADDVFVGPSAVFTNDRFPRAFAVDWAIVPTRVDRGASIGANATIVCGVHIGELAMVGSGAVVTRDVAAHALVTGNPAAISGWVCTCGVSLPRRPALAEPATTDVCASCGLTWRRGLSGDEVTA
jgi:UDP-2-acetamido-3-amino-2,3-dideoxy-glucuronate N-acetyltransferase